MAFCGESGCLKLYHDKDRAIRCVVVRKPELKNFLNKYVVIKRCKLVSEVFDTRIRLRYLMFDIDDIVILDFPTPPKVSLELSDRLVGTFEILNKAPITFQRKTRCWMHVVLQINRPPFTCLISSESFVDLWPLIKEGQIGELYLDKSYNFDKTIRKW